MTAQVFITRFYNLDAALTVSYSVSIMPSQIYWLRTGQCHLSVLSVQSPRPRNRVYRRVQEIEIRRGLPYMARERNTLGIQGSLLLGQNTCQNDTYCHSLVSYTCHCHSALPQMTPYPNKLAWMLTFPYSILCRIPHITYSKLFVMRTKKWIRIDNSFIDIWYNLL